ncbi:hypothetical protein IMG5_159710 [Ichthyophthirius multifiliis]|uniref:Dickkopf N-terminal cysteine-rich domain-containing protein n=1 Tax=Ichthyophthirius multifiliis TaxID=5932 RepID=G0QZT9_ICHMU|nr:hypothetical protein IMG5_159710 [Ichthyophthirius multifiliis]EGR29277.1 hypothetical protein IMG5_159710 [Ichthyophthirius multifiliis]|eukprot:XP_004030513.1 hypothetical protein IMG5_159710 [Ichthyophthirius multifiliis]
MKLFNPKCKAKHYICSQIIKYDSEICAKITDDKNKNYELWPCPFGFQCNTQSFTDQTKQAYCEKVPDSDLIYPNELCSEDLECNSKKCSGGICIGKKEGQDCIKNIDCDAGLYCFLKKCKKQLQFGEECQQDEDCQNNCVCNVKKCMYYYSLDNQIEADNEKACASGYIKDNKCQKGLQSKDIIRPKPCQQDLDCELVDDKGKVQGYSECQCGYNPGSFSYCKVAEGDPEYLDMLNKFQFILYTNFNCHTSLRYGPCKHIYDDEYNDYHAALQKYQQFNSKYKPRAIKLIRIING